MYVVEYIWGFVLLATSTLRGTDPPIEGADGDQVGKQNYPSHAHTMEDHVHGAGDWVVPKYMWILYFILLLKHKTYLLYTHNI